MLFVIIGALWLWISLIWCKKADSSLAFASVFISGIVLFMSAIAWPATYFEAQGNIERFKAVQKTINEARKSGELTELLERATVVGDIINWNAWLSETQYWASWSVTSSFYPSEINELEPIK